MNNSGSGTHFAAIIYRWLLKSLHFLLPLLAGAGDLWWFCGTYLRQRIRELASDVYALFRGGGNSLVKRGGEEGLLLDSKFSPGEVYQVLGGWRSSRLLGKEVRGNGQNYYF